MTLRFPTDMVDVTVGLLAAVSIILVVNVDAYVCPSNSCYYCTDVIARCHTGDKAEAIPQNLSQNLQLLGIHFKSVDNVALQLEKSMLIRYPHLHSLYLYGDFSSIRSNTLEHLSNLTRFYVKQTKIEQLPKDLFAKNVQLIKLWLIENPLQELPTVAFGNGRPAIASMYILDNLVPIKVPCNGGQLQLPSTWRYFTKLRALDFTNVQFHNPNCQRIGDNFFDVGLNLRYLTVSGTNLFTNSQRILSPLNHLSILNINALSPYKDCPAHAKELLANLPTTLRILNMHHWESDREFNRSCQLSRDILRGLERLKQLRVLSFAYNSQAFGAELQSYTLPKLQIHDLQLEFCHISTIGPHSLDKYANLQTLSLSGNTIQPQDYQYLSRPLRKVKSLILQYANLKSHADHRYMAGGILCSYPELQNLDMSFNLLKVMPVFISSERCNKTFLSSMKEFRADNNQISEFFTPYNNQSVNLCHTFPYLKKLLINHNKLRSLDGLEKCVHLDELQLSHNRLGYGTSYNYNSTSIAGPISKLHNLKSIDLSDNNLRYIDFHLMAELPNLEVLHFQSNNLDSIDEELFAMNTKMTEINLRWNYIKSVKSSMFAQMSNLTKLDLSGNLITSFSVEFLHLIDRSIALEYLYIGNNPFHCGCDRYLQTWAITTTKIFVEDQNFLNCGSPSSLKGHSIYSYKIDTFECYYKTITIITASVFGGFLITLFIALPCYKYRWYIRHVRVVWNAFTDTLEKTRQELICEYDAYVSYDTISEEDQRWVAMELMENIEECSTPEERMKLYVEGRDAPGGECKMSVREVALKKSRKILIVASNSYLKSASCLGEADIAGYQMHGVDFYQPNRVLVLVRDELNEEEIIQPPMSSLLLGNVIQVETEERKKRIMWRKIRKFLSKSRYIYHKRMPLSSPSSGISRPSVSDGNNGFNMETEFGQLLED